MYEEKSDPKRKRSAAILFAAGQRPVLPPSSTALEESLENQCSSIPYRQLTGVGTMAEGVRPLQIVEVGYHPECTKETIAFSASFLSALAVAAVFFEKQRLWTGEVYWEAKWA